MNENHRPNNIKLTRCSHGTYHLSVGKVTLHISEDDLSAIVASANELAESEPTLLGKMLLDASRSTKDSQTD